MSGFCFSGYVEPPKVLEGQHILRNLQHKSLYLIQQLTTNHTVRQCTCISDPDSDLSIKRAVLLQKPFICFKISKDTETYFKANITRHGKKENEKDEAGNVLLNLKCFYLSIA